MLLSSIRRTTILVSIATVCLAGPASTQMKMVIEAEGEIYQIGELGALVMEQDGKIIVLNVMPAEVRLKAYRQVDIEQDDAILMVNGKRMKSIADLKAVLESVEPGEQIKIGLKRGKRMQMTSYVKANPEDLPKMKIMTMTDDDGADAGEQLSGGTVITIGGSEEGLALLMGSGLLAQDSDDGVLVAATMPDADDILGKGKVKEGDRIVSLDDTEISSAEALNELWDKIKAGSSVTLVLSREGKEFTVTFKKKDSGSADVMMMKKTK